MYAKVVVREKLRCKAHLTHSHRFSNIIGNVTGNLIKSRIQQSKLKLFTYKIYIVLTYLKDIQPYSSVYSTMRSQSAHNILTVDVLYNQYEQPKI